MAAAHLAAGHGESCEPRLRAAVIPILPAPVLRPSRLHGRQSPRLIWQQCVAVEIPCRLCMAALLAQSQTLYCHTAYIMWI